MFSGGHFGCGNPIAPTRQTVANDSQAIEYATALHCKQVNCLAGIAPDDVDEATTLQTFVSNLRFAAERLEQAGIRLVTEPLNTVDVPGFYQLRARLADISFHQRSVRTQFRFDF